MKNIIKTASLLLFAVFFACSNNTSSPGDNSNSNSADPAELNDGISFNGNSNSGNIQIFLADNYLKKVANGNPYDVVPGVFGMSTMIIKADVKLTGFSYLGQSVDITCDRDEAANKLYVALTGSNPLGQDIQFMINPNDGLFYTYEIPSGTLIGAQGPLDEIEKVYVSDSNSNYTPVPAPAQTFLCMGSDGNEYNLLFYSDYDPNNMQIQSVFDIQDNVFTGVVEVVKKYVNDEPVQLFFDK